MSRPRSAALAAFVCACSGTTGTVNLELATAPGSHLLDGVQRLRLTLTEPHQVIEATRTAQGFDLALDLQADGATGSLIVEGFDADDQRIACGQSPPFPIAAVNAHIVVYVAAPLSVALAPQALGAPLSEVSGTTLAYGAVLAGGRDASGAPSSAIGIYNAYDHSFLAGAAMPAARAGVSIATGNGGTVYLFGGTGPDGKPTGTLWRFDTNLAPAGGFTPLTERVGFERTGQLMVTIVPELYIITGTPPVELRLGSLTAPSDLLALPATGAAGFTANHTPTAIFDGVQLVRYQGGVFDVREGSGRTDATAASLPDGSVVVLGGGNPPSQDARVIDSTTGNVKVIPNVLTTARSRPSLATTSRYVIVVGGTDAAGAPIATAEVHDAGTLAAVGPELPILPRTGVVAITLPNDQVLLAGGTPAASEIELFTPDPPP